MRVDVNIDDYLSEEDKKEIAIDVFRQQVKRELFNGRDGTVQSDSEVQRVIGNITSEVVFLEVQKYIPDAKDQIVSRIREMMADYNLEPALNEELSNKFDELAGTMYGLSELFNNK